MTAEDDVGWGRSMAGLLLLILSLSSMDWLETDNWTRSMTDRAMTAEDELKRHTTTHLLTNILLSRSCPSINQSVNQ